LTSLKEKHNKTLPNISKCPNDDAIEHPGKKAASTSLKFQDRTLLVPRPIHQKDKVVVELSNDGVFSSIHCQGMYIPNLAFLFKISSSYKSLA